MAGLQAAACGRTIRCIAAELLTRTNGWPAVLAAMPPDVAAALRTDGRRLPPAQTAALQIAGISMQVPAREAANSPAIERRGKRARQRRGPASGIISETRDLSPVSGATQLTRPATRPAPLLLSTGVLAEPRRIMRARRAAADPALLPRPEAAAAPASMAVAAEAAMRAVVAATVAVVTGNRSLACCNRGGQCNAVHPS
jgi:hypothetical protein